MVSSGMASSAPDGARLRSALARHRLVSALLLTLLVLLAWGWLLSGAGTGMAPRLALWPQTGAREAMPGMVMEPATAWSASRFAVTLAMWWVMMAAMMLPSAAPMILLFARAAGTTAPRPTTGAFLAGYLAIWGLFALAATVLQWLFGRLDWLAPLSMTLTSRQLDAGLLLLAGLYQLTPFKNACLSRCRDPARFLSQHYRQGRLGAWRMGLEHGAFCLGCCWLLMALLFVGGVMNVAWIAFLTVLVALEKLVPHGRLIAWGSGLALIAGAILLLR